MAGLVLVVVVAVSCLFGLLGLGSVVCIMVGCVVVCCWFKGVGLRVDLCGNMLVVLWIAAVRTFAGW